MKKIYIALNVIAFVWISGGSVSWAQQTRSGTITDDSGLPLPGATVLVENTNRGVTTDFDGNFSIVAAAGEVLVISYVGYSSQKITTSAAANYNIMLQPETALEEVIITAFGTSTKESFTGSAAVVSAKDLEIRTVTSPIAALEGTTTGVQFISANGQPGASPDIVIRGVGTLNGETDPLFIVDGVQFEGELNTLNQDDIASFTILRDASSSALYGSRAANGVVLITTKKGKNDKIQVNFTTQYGASYNAIQPYDRVNPGTFYELMWESYKNALGGEGNESEASENIYNRLGYNPFDVPNDQIVGTNGKLNPNAKLIYKDLDWRKFIERQGERVNHSVNISGGDEKFQVYFSGSWLDEDGYVIESNFNRTTSRLSADFSPKEWLKIGGSANIALNKTTNLASTGLSSIVNVFNWTLDLGPIYPVYINDRDGNYVLDAAGKPRYDLGEGYDDYGIQSRPYSPGRHAIAEIKLNDRELNTNNTGFRYYTELSLLEGLSLRLNYGQDIQESVSKRYENHIVGDGAPTGRYGETRFRRTVENFNQIITYNKTITDAHRFELTLGHESYNRHYTENRGSSTVQTAVGIAEFENFSTPVRLRGFSEAKTLEGYFARLNYDFNNRYYLSGSFRRDGSSVFNSAVRWGSFYSLGASWRIDQENFMQNVDFVNSLKLRASYGEVGNDNLDDFYISQARYELTSNAGDPAILWTNLGNNQLTWETVDSWDAALEFSVFDTRLSGTFEFYRKTSSELLYNLPIPTSNGFNEKPDNIGSMYNQGIELSLTGKIFNTPEFDWTVTSQNSTLKNRITDLPTPFVNGSKRWAEGRSRYDFYIYDYAGVDPDNGDALYYMYEDDETTDERVPVLNDDGTHATSNDWSDAGKGYVDAATVPKVIGSLRNDLRYKGVGLSFLITYAFGGKLLDYGYADLMHPGNYGRAMHTDATKAWRKAGDITTVPRLENGNSRLTQRMSSRYLTDASFITLRNVNLSYSFDNTFVQDLGLSNLRLFLSGENLSINSKRKGLDPQYNLAGTPPSDDYNPSRVISFGLNASF